MMSLAEMLGGYTSDETSKRRIVRKRKFGR